jgi:hypothetical protein
MPFSAWLFAQLPQFLYSYGRFFLYDILCVSFSWFECIIPEADIFQSAKVLQIYILSYALLTRIFTS